MENFTAIDVELANSDPASVCEIGAARFRGGGLVETWRALVNPGQEFETPFHSRLHGVNASHVQSAPTVPEIYPTLKRLLEDEPCVVHNSGGFDETCLSRTCARFGLPDVTEKAIWHNSLDMARRCWPDVPSYKLESLCKLIGHEYVPHNALEDAMACAAVALAASGIGNITALAGSGGGDRPRTFRRAARTRHQKGWKGNPDGPFYKTYVVLTGIFASPWDDRARLEEHLNGLGFVPRGSISGRTQLLIAGDGAGPEKIRRAQEEDIPILDEDGLWTLIKEALPEEP